MQILPRQTVERGSGDCSRVGRDGKVQPPSPRGKVSRNGWVPLNSPRPVWIVAMAVRGERLVAQPLGNQSPEYCGVDPRTRAKPIRDGELAVQAARESRRAEREGESVCDGLFRPRRPLVRTPLGPPQLPKGGGTRHPETPGPR